MPGLKTNERPGTRAELRHVIVSAYKVREVLDLIRGLEVQRAQDVLKFCGRGSAPMIAKLLHSAVSNAEHNDGMAPEELYVSACYADESRTLKRWRARARGRYTRVRKRTCHVTIIVSRLPEDRLIRARAKQAQEAGARRARRVAGGRKAQRAEAAAPVVEEETPVVEEETPVVEEVEAEVTDEARPIERETPDSSEDETQEEGS
jgi:large subunit ribosomal protein L22